MDENMKAEIKKMIDDALKKAASFSTRKVGDIPTDLNQLTPQKYVDANGTIANRPTNAVTGQQFFASTLSYPIFFNGTDWVNSVGSIVAGAA